MSMKIINLDTTSLGDRSYIAHDGKTALVVDPQRDIDRVEEILSTEGVQIGAIVETHMHNDYVSGGLVLAKKYGATYITSADDDVKFDRKGVADQEVVNVGDFAVQALHTPGHTFTHMSYILLNPENTPKAIFTGGSMLHGSTGRPDLLGWENAPSLAGLQHGSAQRIAELLEDQVSIRPTHGFGSFCAATSTSGDSSTIADEKRTNPALLLDKKTFIEQTLAGLDAFPSYYKFMGPANYAGAGPIDLSQLNQMTTDEVMKAINLGTWVVDLRPKDLFAQGHLPGSLSFGIDGSFATYFGWLFPYDQKVILVSNRNDDIELAQRELVRIGIDRPEGALIKDFTDVTTLVSNKKVTFDDVVDALEDPEIVVLDVRRNGERHASYIEGTVHIPLHELKSRINELPHDKEIWIHCAGAYRAAGALGILESAGHKPVLINQPYDACQKVVGLKKISETVDAGPVAPSDVKASA